MSDKGKKTSTRIVANYDGESIQFTVYVNGGENGEKTIAECDFGDPYESDSIGGIVDAMISDGAVDVIVFDAN